MPIPEGINPDDEEAREHESIDVTPLEGLDRVEIIDDLFDEVETEWEVLERQLTGVLGELVNDYFLVIDDFESHHYVQFAVGPNGVYRAEARSNQWITEPTELLTARQYAAMTALGWHAPTYIFDAKAQPSEGGPNFFMEFASPPDCAWLAGVAVKTLRNVYDTPSISRLRYCHFHGQTGENVLLLDLMLRPRPFDPTIFPSV